METVQGMNNWKLRCRKEADHVVILKAETCDQVATLPDTLWGLPVTALGNHALRQGWPIAQEGEEIQLVWGAEDADAQWDNRRLRKLTLPDTLRHIGEYALCNCEAMWSLTLWDSIAEWGSNALMNCRSLYQISIARVGEGQGESLCYFASELNRELDVTVTHPDGACVRLVFPEYEEDYEENYRSLQFSYSIVGSGYPYHHCFRQKQLSMREYDGIFKEFMAKKHEVDCAIRIAYYRLRHPLELGEEAKARYIGYLQANCAVALPWLVEQRDVPGLTLVLGVITPERGVLSAACEQARQTKLPEAVALLLEKLHQLEPPTTQQRFAL